MTPKQADANEPCRATVTAWQERTCVSSGWSTSVLMTDYTGKDIEGEHEHRTARY